MTTTASQEAFLQAFHAERPAVTAEAFGRGRAPDGRSSYELLCDRVAGSSRVLDLGCGDGSFDACVSHMALMLMGEIEQVAAEVARVLCPGGVLACVVGGGAVGGESYERFLGLLRRTIAEAPAARRIPALGDRRTRSRDGLDEVLGPAGFGPVSWETVPIDLSGPVEEVWAAVSGLYDLGPLDGGTVERLREAFVAEVRAMTTPEGIVPCAFTIHLATTRLGGTLPYSPSGSKSSTK
ncbi:class I SAM-dependent methyltransferase [Streptomyces asiaticus]|uniref:class I SAM-dependent methyltransferase n=1 Tax=Streptomyces asiaticus TaxID=114695 RepID=UPI0039BE329A